jgi:hypothetical protein
VGHALHRGAGLVDSKTMGTRACRLLKFRWLIPHLYDLTTTSGQRQMQENYADTLALYEERRTAITLANNVM